MNVYPNSLSSFCVGIGIILIGFTMMYIILNYDVRPFGFLILVPIPLMCCGIMVCLMAYDKEECKKYGIFAQHSFSNVRVEN